VSELGRRTRWGKIGTHALLIVIACSFAAPLVWMVATSLKPPAQAMRTPPTLLPEPASETLRFAAENYSAVWNDPVIDFPLYLRNSLVVALLNVVGMTLSSAIAAYGFARVPWRGKKAVFALLLATLMVPFPVLMAPLYVIFSNLGWIGSLKPLWVPAFFANAFNVFLLRQFFLSIPKEIDEAARIDGCGHWRIFWTMILPLSRPALVVVALLHFTYTWNDFIQPLIFTTHRDQFTLALGLQLFQSQAGFTPWARLMAASTMVIAPVLVLFLVAQGAFVKGIAAEGLKE
jgi:multiple sugar transport system permease protein